MAINRDRKPLIATLADVEFAHECELDAVRHSTTDEVLKETIVRKLQRQHRERRAPYIRQIDALHEQTDAVPA